MIKVLWYPKRFAEILEKPKIIFATSNRMRVYNFHEFIKQDPEIQSEIMGYSLREVDPNGFDIIIFQKRIPSKWQVLNLLANPRKLVVFDICDPCDVRVARRLKWYCDLVVTSNDELTEDLIQKGLRVPVETIVDAHEANPQWQKEHIEKERIRVTWYGIGVNYFKYIKPMRSLLDQDYIDFRCACGEDHDPSLRGAWGSQKGIQWDLDYREAWQREDSWQRFIFDSDVGIVPVVGAIKSPHKILNYMAYGIPVVCSPADSHQRIIRHGENGFFASEQKEWKDYLEMLRDPELRNKIGREARKTALLDYSLPQIAKCYQDVLVRHYGNKRMNILRRILG